MCEVNGNDFTCTEICGDGIQTKNEECDDNNDIAGDGCSSECRVEPGWLCSVVNDVSQCEEECGDGVQTQSELCDPKKNKDACIDCSSVIEGWACTQEACLPICGDGQ